MRRIVLIAWLCACGGDDDAGGAEKTYPGEFDLCTHDPIPAVGARVRIEWGTATILAASCEGNPDCPDSDEVQIVQKLVAAE